MFSIFRSTLTVVLLLAAGLVSAQEQNMIGHQSHNVGLNIVPAPGEIAIDGDLSEWDWSGRIWVFADVSVRARYSVEAAAMWDEEYLYLGAIWKDPTPMFNMIDPAFNPNEGWKADCWQIRIQSDRIGHLTSWYFTEGDMPVMHVNYSQAGSGGETFVLTAPDGNDLGRGVQMAFRKHDDDAGFNQEIRVPWSIIYGEVPAIEPGLMLRLGFEFLWGDPTGRTWPQHRYADNMQPGVTSREFYWSNTRAWGNATLLAEGNIEPRQYVSGSGRLEGTVPIRFDIPENAAKFTVVIEDAEGSRIRNLAGDFDPAEYTIAVQNGVRTIEVLWDCLDDSGTMVAPGTYTTRGLYHGGIGAEYQQCFYNPGTPPWEVRDGTGSWGADHGAPSAVTAGGDMVALSWSFAEGGSGIIGVGPDGLKKWGEKRGTRVLAADENYVYAIIASWYTTGALSRFGIKDGSFQPFVRNGVQRPFELSMKNILEENDEMDDVTREGHAIQVEALGGLDDLIKSPVSAMASNGEQLLLSFGNGGLAVLDASSAAVIRLLEMPSIQSMAFNSEGQLYALIGGQLHAVNIENAERTTIATPGVGRAVAMTIDKDGYIVIADAGADSQVKAFNLEGELVYAIGHKGGRAPHGKFDPQGFRSINSVAVDHAGDIWVVEYTNDPRRVSVWNREGELVRQYLGNTAYAGTGSYLHDEDPTLAYVGSVEMKLDPATRGYDVTRILWVPDASRNEAFPLWAHPHSFPNPKMLSSNASGQRRRYLYFNGVYSRYQAIYMEKDDVWQPVAALTHVKDLPEPIRNNVFEAINPNTGVIWNDTNGDGRISLDECILVEGGLILGAGWGQLPGHDLSIYATDSRQIVRYAPASFTDAGAPVYTPDSIKRFAFNTGGVRGVSSGEIIPLDNEDRLLVIGRAGIQGVERESGKVLWRYPNPYDGVHGSHEAPMPQPGMLIGILRALGVADVEDGVGNVLAMRGNLGQDFYMTSDGLYVTAMFQDGRLPAPGFPETEDMLAGMPMEMFSVGGEPFSGWFGRHNDGRVRVLTGQPRQAAMILEVIGLNSIKRFAGPALNIDVPLLVRAEQDNASRAAAAEEQKEYKIVRAPREFTIDGNPQDWEGVESMPLERTGSPQRGTARLAYDDNNLYALFEIQDRSPWRNTGRDFSRLFKTGDAVDLQLCVDPNASTDRRDVVAGDVRVLISQLDGKPVAVLMKPKDPAAPAEVNRVYVSPVQPRSFDRVQIMQSARLSVRVQGDRYTVEAAIPLAEIGLEPRPGLTISGDAGFISSDEQGMINIARTYWSNKLTNLTSDKPAESWLYPNQWGILIFE